MRHNNLTNYGRDMSCLLKLVEILPQTKIESIECAPAPKCFVFMSAPVYTAVFTASRLSDNSIGGCYDDDGEFVANTEGIIALYEGLKGSSVTSLECAANPKCSPSCQRPLTLILPLAAWPVTSSAASIMRVTAPTPPRASPSSARGSGGAP